MNMRKRALTGAISIILLLSLLLLLVNIICNVHLHLIANGTVLFHAHPYQKDSQQQPFKTHPHARFELLIYDFITHIFEYSVLILMLWITALTIKAFRFIQFLNIPSNTFIFIPLMRAPPIAYVPKEISLKFISTFQ